MTYTNSPSHEAARLIEREQNLQFIDYCPRCNEWMDKKFTKKQGISDINEPKEVIMSYTCKVYNTKRLPNEELIL